MVVDGDHLTIEFDKAGRKKSRCGFRRKGGNVTAADNKPIWKITLNIDDGQEIAEAFSEAIAPFADAVAVNRVPTNAVERSRQNYVIEGYCLEQPDQSAVLLALQVTANAYDFSATADGNYIFTA